MRQLNHIKKHILSVLKGGDILFIVPPFITTNYPILGVHILQFLAEERKYKTEILYLNMLLASAIGIERFEYISFPPLELMWRMLNERLFARSAYGLPPLGKSPEYCLDEAMSTSGDRQHYNNLLYESDEFNIEEYLEEEKICNALVNETVAAIGSLNYKMIGCTSRVGQTNCSIALLNGIKSIRPDIITLIGGADCKGEMAQGIASLSSAIDYIFSGESELSFCNFLQSYSTGELPSERIIRGKPLMDLDSVPLPDYTCFLNQTECFLGKDALKKTSASYETSRGCWWGEKQRCNFCSEDSVFRQKTSQRVLNDVKQISMNYQTKGIFMCDIVIPLSYHKEVFPELLKEKEAPNIYYQSKVNLNLQDFINFKKAKADQFTMGIEAFSTGLLKLMNKGISARQNLKLLRNARSVGTRTDWLLLWGFPGDKLEYYQETLKILPLIRHLQPPVTCLHLILARFSPYFENPEAFQIINIRPWAVYNMVFPEWADLDNLAYWFAGDYPCGAHENLQLIKEIAQEVALWKTLWETTYLVMVPFSDYYLILDNRDNNGKKQHVLDYQKAKEIMTDCVYHESEYQQWAVEEKLGVIADSWYIPLVTASPELLLQFEDVDSLI